MVFKWRLKACLFGLAVLVSFIHAGVMTPDEAEGCVLWALLFWLGWKMLRAQRGATPSTEPAERVKVSQMGPAWEQDVPYPEVFDEEDDL